MREKNRKALEALARARPDALDPARLAGSASRRPDPTELMSARPAHRTGRRVVAWRRMLVPSVGLAAAAAVAIGAVAVGVVQDHGTRTAANPDGHLMLLTMAESVQNQAASGNYWQYQTQSRNLYLIRPADQNPRPYVLADTAQNNWSIGVKPGEPSLMVSNLNEKRGPWTPEDTHRWMMAGSPTTVTIDDGVGAGVGKDKHNTLAMKIGSGQPIVNHENYGAKIASVGPDNVDYDYLRSLPNDQAQLAQTFAGLYGRSAGNGPNDEADWMFTQLSELITLPVSSAVRAAAYRVLANLPGITSLGTVTDPLGRSGVAVALPPMAVGDLGQQQRQLIVDPDTNTILSQQVVLVAPSPLAAEAGLTAGTVVNYTATTRIGWTDQPVALPTTP